MNYYVGNAQENNVLIFEYVNFKIMILVIRMLKHEIEKNDTMILICCTHLKSLAKANIFRN